MHRNFTLSLTILAVFFLSCSSLIESPFKEEVGMKISIKGKVVNLGIDTYGIDGIATPLNFSQSTGGKKTVRYKIDWENDQDKRKSLELLTESDLDAVFIITSINESDWETTVKIIST